MLRSFRVDNHKSFRDEAELLLIPAYDKTRQVTPVAAIIGANASGKSNLLDALRWLQTAVRESYAGWEPGAGVPRTPFRLDPAASAKPSLYCVEIIIDGSRYTYGLELDDERVLEEWLYTYPRNRRRIVFERDRNGVRLGSTVPDYRARGEQLARQTRDNALLLSVAAHNDVAEVQAVYSWFRTGLRLADGVEIAQDQLLNRLSDQRQRPTLVALIGAADLGVSDITTVDTSDAAALEEKMAANRRAAEVLLEEIDRLQQEYYEHVSDARRQALSRRLFRDKLDKAQVLMREVGVLEKEKRRIESAPRLRFHHGTSRVALSLGDQSAGTRNWLRLLSHALEVFDHRGLLVVDEVDASLHPHLTSRLINLFRDPETNPESAQLLLTTHDATLLDEETLSRDEIWFVEKEPDSGTSRLYPLTDFHPRKNENTEGRYLAGGYGAIPILSEYRFRKALRSDLADDAAA